MRKYILYIGEDTDFSDRWLAGIVQKYRKMPIVFLKPGGKTLHFPILIINRLYTSAVYRYGKRSIMELVRRLIFLEERKIPIINSSSGYLMDLDREKQCTFLNSRHIPYVQTLKVNSVLYRRKQIIFPCVLKTNPSGRNETLKIVTDKKSLFSTPSDVRKNSVLQSVVKKPICYRTEFVGDWHVTYPQEVHFHKNRLNFHKIYRIIPTPLSRLLRKRLIKSMGGIGVYAFSVEYFMKKNNLVGIVDFNLTSNYHPIFIKITKGRLKSAWQKLMDTK